MKFVVFTCDKNQHLLRGFTHQWSKYCGLPLLISGTNALRYRLDGICINLNTGNYPLEQWSDQVIDTMDKIDDDFIVFLLDDYWLIRNIDITGIKIAEDVLSKTKSAYAFDLSTNSLYGEKIEIGKYRGYDLFVNNNEYAYSYQAYLWKKSALLSCLRKGENPWESEMRGLARMHGNPNGIISCKQTILWYANVMYKGNWDFDGHTVIPQRTLIKDDWDNLDKMGYI